MKVCQLRIDLLNGGLAKIQTLDPQNLRLCFTGLFVSTLGPAPTLKGPDPAVVFLRVPRVPFHKNGVRMHQHQIIRRLVTPRPMY